MRTSFLFTLLVAKLSGNFMPAKLAGNSEQKALAGTRATRGTGAGIRQKGGERSMNTIQQKQGVIVQSSQIRRLLRVLGWKDYRLDHPEQRSLKRAGVRVNGVPWPIARILINLDADEAGVELDPGQLRRVVRLEAAGYFRDHLEGE